MSQCVLNNVVGGGQTVQLAVFNNVSQCVLNNVVGGGQTVQLAVFNNVSQCVLNNVEGVCQTGIHLLNNRSNIYCHYFCLNFHSEA